MRFIEVDSDKFHAYYEGDRNFWTVKIASALKLSKFFQINEYNGNGFCVFKRNQRGGKFYLVIKGHTDDHPSYDTFVQALLDMKKIIKNNNIKYIAILEDCVKELDWEYLKDYIQAVFLEMDINIIIIEEQK